MLSQHQYQQIFQKLDPKCTAFQTGVGKDWVTARLLTGGVKFR